MRRDYRVKKYLIGLRWKNKRQHRLYSRIVYCMLAISIGESVYLGWTLYNLWIGLAVTWFLIAMIAVHSWMYASIRRDFFPDWHLYIHIYEDEKGIQD
jgi:hypothetical protein